MTTINGKPELILFSDADRLAVAAADFICQQAGDAVQARGRFTLVLAGGSTPEKTYSLLAAPERIAKIDWAKVFLFFGDERLVPYDDPRSNYHLAQRTLISQVPIADEQVFLIPTSGNGPAEAAKVYAASLAKLFALPMNGEPPCFDLILLGLGDDGHTASLFPGAAALKEDRAWVTWSPPGTLPPPVDRVTMTFSLLNAARQILFLVKGANKAEALRDVIEGDAPIERRPAAGIRPREGKVTWMVDQEAAQLLQTAPRG